MSTECQRMSVDGLPCPPMASTRERDGRYIGLYRDPAGRQRSAGTFATNTKALDHAKALEHYNARGDYVTRSAVSLAEFAVPFIDRQSIKSVDNDRQYWKHLDAEFGRRKIGSITTRDIQDFIDAKAAGGYAKESRAKMKNLLSKIMKAALLQSPPLIKHNPVPGVQLGADGAPVERPYPTPDEVRAICAMLEHQDALMVQTLYACGPRASELGRLEARHLNPQRRTLYIAGTKSAAASRTVPVPATLCAELAVLTGARDPGDPLFMSITGRHMNMPNWRKRTYNEARDQAGVADNVDLHALRHGALTNWAQYGAAKSVMELMKWSGHKDMRTMMRYQHFYDDIDVDAASAIDNLLAPPLPADVLPMRRG